MRIAVIQSNLEFLLCFSYPPGLRNAERGKIDDFESFRTISETANNIVCSSPFSLLMKRYCLSQLRAQKNSAAGQSEKAF